MSKKIHVKPGRAPSGAGFFMGLLFCIIGIFIAIPTFGLFGIVWTLAAAAITVFNGINAFSAKGFSTHRIEVEDDVPPMDRNDAAQYRNSGPASKEETIEDRLTALNDIYRKELITEDEYEEKRKSILEEL